MAIKSSTFGRTELTEKDAVRFLEQFIRDKKTNPAVQERIASARKRYDRFASAVVRG